MIESVPPLKAVLGECIIFENKAFPHVRIRKWTEHTYWYEEVKLNSKGKVDMSARVCGGDVLSFSRVKYCSRCM